MPSFVACRSHEAARSGNEFSTWTPAEDGPRAEAPSKGGLHIVGKNVLFIHVLYSRQRTSGIDLIEANSALHFSVLSRMPLADGIITCGICLGASYL